jgi:hypothetical protein
MFGAPPEDATPPLPDSAYLGTYVNDFVGTATVEAAAGGMELVLGPEGQVRYPLTHFDRDTFLYYSSPEMPQMPSPLTFRVGPDGVAETIVVDSMNSAGMGTLTRQKD